MNADQSLLLLSLALMKTDHVKSLCKFLYIIFIYLGLL